MKQDILNFQKLLNTQSKPKTGFLNKIQYQNFYTGQSSKSPFMNNRGQLLL